MGGTIENPSYQQVITGSTGHAEVVQLEYDPSIISYSKLLEIFWENIDPTAKNMQGPDVGTEYRSVIFYHTAEQEKLARRSKEELEKSGRYKKPIVTEIVLASTFWRAEEYHQHYHEKHGGGCLF
jgi:peptide-methionine (S)-S-oxide reductase